MKTGNTSLKVAGLVWKLKYQSKGSWNNMKTGRQLEQYENWKYQSKGSWNSMETGNTSLKVARIVWKLEILVLQVAGIV